MALGDGSLRKEDQLITISQEPASDSWGFVGVFRVGNREIYRTLTSYVSPQEAQHAATDLFGDVLGELLAGREWQRLKDRDGRVPTRRDLGLGLTRSRDGGGPES